MGRKFRYETGDRTLIVHLPEELDHHNCRSLKAEMELLMAENYITKLVFDFTGTGFMDSSGIGLVLGRYKQMRGCGGKTCFYGAGPQILRIMKTAGILGLIERYGSKEAALRE